MNTPLPHRAPTLFERWRIYLIESYKPAMKLIPSFLIAIAAISTQAAQFPDIAPASMLPLVLLGGTTIALFLLYVRIADEFKDYEVDCVYFPDRPVPSGRVQLNDLRPLKWATIGAILVLNYICADSFFLCLLTMLYFMLTEVWFFLPRLIANNRLLAFISHAPAYWLMNLYVVSLFANQHGLALYTKSNLMLATWFLLPAMAWEIARKTRAPAHEQRGYQTYSAMLGYRLSTLLSVALIAAHVSISLYMAPIWGFHYIIQWALLANAALYSAHCIGFIRAPVRAQLKSRCEYYMIICYVLMVANAVHLLATQPSNII